ncbi:hypothetical protein K2173_010100 [Erythroxylum novogranatense]|uniref:Exocyst subunit Exo70 family protein n=1 Tax=Erythroxylum novogranatense TaxID=1862640 RepID=A0AAV8SBX0_9ROSI|nr:hypothetical protein K2173_010100 [Erythroxylum novogranatense]
MGNFEPITPEVEVETEENLVATVTNDEKKVFSDLGSQLSSMALICQEEFDKISDFEGPLNDIQAKVLNWEADQSIIWERGPDEATKYLNVVDEARTLTEKLEALSLSNEDGVKEMLLRAHNVLQMVMARLEEEFKNILVENSQPYDPDLLSFGSSEEEFADVGLNRTSEEFTIDLVHQDKIHDLRCTANVMFKSNYGHECVEYVTLKQDVLDECLFVLEMEKMSIGDVLKLEWGNLSATMKRWARAMKTFVRIYLMGEKWLSEQVFGDLGVNLMCFSEASKPSMFQLLNFGEAISIGPHKTEKLYSILEMYKVLEDLLPDIDSLYSDEADSSVRTEFHEVLRRLGDAVRAAFLEFENAVATCTSTTPLATGGIHPSTKYVMNYVRTLTDYHETLNLLLEDHSREDAVETCPDKSPALGEESTSEDACAITPMACHFLSIVSILERNIEDKAKLYKNPSLRQVFLINNIHYMAQKVKNSELRLIFGDDWIRKRNWKVQQHAWNYERVTWSSVLGFFYLAFEEVYKNQKGWSIPDDQLRKDLRISISNKVILAYRSFVGRHSYHVKSSLEDMFEGMQKQLQYPHRR